MAVDSRNLFAFFNVDSDFRSWGSGIAAQLTACGLIQTTDTGQINWTTVAKPTAANTVMGYEIWRFSDTLQSTCPLFLKIEYGGGIVTTMPGIWITVGPASNGSGTLVTNGATGLGTRTQLSGKSTKSAGITFPSYCSGSMVSTTTGGRIMFATNIETAGGANNGYAFIIERTRGGDGVPTSDGALTFFTGGNSVGSDFQGYQFFRNNAVQPALVLATSQPNNAVFPALATTTLAGHGGPNGASVAFCPMTGFYGKPLYGTSCAYSTSDVAGFSTTVTGSHFGATHNFIVFSDTLGANSFAVTYSSQGVATMRMACLYE